MSRLSIGIVGAGWYGCHLGLTLKQLGFNVQIFEKNHRVLHEASGNNQFRLHLGFHYARHHGTRIQSRDGFMRFIERYPSLSREVDNNLYAVPKYDSLIDFSTYRLIMTSSGLDYQVLQDNSFHMSSFSGVEINDVDGVMRTSERVILLSEARSYFETALSSSLNLDCKVDLIVGDDKQAKINDQSFDFVIDCSWGHLLELPIPLFYEPTILLYYECKHNFPAITLVDGNLGSIYPTEDPNVYTLSSVVHTPISRCSDSASARNVISKVDSVCVNEKRALMEEHISSYVPSFADAMKFIGPQLSIKTKPTGSVDDRSCYVYNNGRVISVMSGKIDTVFHAFERVLNIMQSEIVGAGSLKQSTLRDDIDRQRFLGGV